MTDKYIRKWASYKSNQCRFWQFNRFWLLNCLIELLFNQFLIIASVVHILVQFVVEQKDFTAAVIVILCFNYVTYIYSFFFILFVLQFLLLIWLIDLFFFLNIEYIDFLIYIVVIDVLKFLIVSLIINKRSVLRRIHFLSKVHLIIVFTVIVSS